MTRPAGLTLFIPCELRNYANHGGHWTSKAGYQQRLRDKTHALALVAQHVGDGPRLTLADAAPPKTVELTAYVWNYFDSHDGLRNALKPIVDGLVRAAVLHSDAHDCGHQFLYTQILDRAQRGVRIVVTPR